MRRGCEYQIKPPSKNLPYYRQVSNQSATHFMKKIFTSRKFAAASTSGQVVQKSRPALIRIPPPQGGSISSLLPANPGKSRTPKKPHTYVVPLNGKHCFRGHENACWGLPPQTRPTSGQLVQKLRRTALLVASWCFAPFLKVRAGGPFGPRPPVINPMVTGPFSASTF
jgi:hypothetical protein